jgi:hypothetical protein
MRRGFWLATGAVLGVAGYRKASRIARAVTGAAVPAKMVSSGPRALNSGREARPAVALTVARTTGRVRSAASFARDVREGMAEYRELHGRQLGRSLGDQRGREPGRGNQRGSIEP